MRYLVLLFILVLLSCANGDPLPQATGPWEPLNGWQPGATEQPAPTLQAQHK